MTYVQVRWYLFCNSYACHVFQEYLHAARRKERQRIKQDIERALLFDSISKIPQTKVKSICSRHCKLSVYIRIEKELIALIRERKERGEFDLDEYEYALLDPAIERVAGSDLSRIEDDREFDQKLIERIAHYKHWYYQTAQTYRLPPSGLFRFY